MEEPAVVTQHLNPWVDFLREDGRDILSSPTTLLEPVLCARILGAAAMNSGKIVALIARFSGFVLAASAALMAARDFDSQWLAVFAAGAALVIASPQLWKRSSEPSVLGLERLARNDETLRVLKALDAYCRRAALGDLKLYDSADGRLLPQTLFAGNKGRALIIAAYAGNESEIDRSILGHLKVERELFTVADESADRAMKGSKESDNIDRGSDGAAVTVTAVATSDAAAPTQDLSGSAFHGDVEEPTASRSGGDRNSSRRRPPLLEFGRGELPGILDDFLDLGLLNADEMNWFKSYMIAAHRRMQKPYPNLAVVAKYAMDECRKEIGIAPSLGAAEGYIGTTSKGPYSSFPNYLRQRISERPKSDDSQPQIPGLG